ncbi:hypothetical protein F5J12DRAFT_892184 [Pisolithus orientalis]|uniref:uncharacterized protein n=1 Tax=Pisolithus orientalis TaxID=936130 RepID=UPI002224F4BA|nr:uncharacterized protein F5J12DRAFT_892184 [Pisolithus orientalis]KAI6008178.1 hypothetical protein F5J12DRAFT_892184 [Pisolithus orientalis]
MDLIHTDVLKYFQYAMLSHHWDEETEPSLCNIEGHPIYGMSAKGSFGKLQGFCCVALEWGYLWAWSDMCYIDRHSSAKVQEMIGSMFACLFECSEWFKHGWTLQELLAPKCILFYTPNWSLYKNLVSLNHKTDVAVLEELMMATGIES